MEPPAISRGSGPLPVVDGGHAVVQQRAVGWFLLEAQQEVFANGPDTRVSIMLAPSSMAAEVAGGYRLSGEWRYNSGSLRLSSAKTFLEKILPAAEAFLDKQKPIGTAESIWWAETLVKQCSNATFELTTLTGWMQDVEQHPKLSEVFRMPVHIPSLNDLIGIFLMNIEWFNRSSSGIGLGMPLGLTGIDWFASWFIAYFIQGKFWTIFSLLFGMGRRRVELSFIRFPSCVQRRSSNISSQP